MQIQLLYTVHNYITTRFDPVIYKSCSYIYIKLTLWNGHSIDACAQLHVYAYSLIKFKQQLQQTIKLKV